MRCNAKGAKDEGCSGGIVLIYKIEARREDTRVIDPSDASVGQGIPASSEVR